MSLPPKDRQRRCDADAVCGQQTMEIVDASDRAVFQRDDEIVDANAGGRGGAAWFHCRHQHA